MTGLDEDCALLMVPVGALGGDGVVTVVAGEVTDKLFEPSAVAVKVCAPTLKLVLG